MGIPETLVGDRWTEVTARYSLPMLVWCAKKGKTITYGQLDQEIVDRGLGHHVMAIQYGWPAGAIGNALIEIEAAWEDQIPPINALVVNAKSGLPGKGVNYYLEHYYNPPKSILKMTLNEKKAVIEEIHSEIYSYKYWDDILEQCSLKKLRGSVKLGKTADKLSKPKRGGWSSEGESEEHKRLKNYVAKNPRVVGLPKNTQKGVVEYTFASADSADVVFETENGYVGVEVKSHISNNADTNRGIFQAIKYQALLRAEQRAVKMPPTSTAVLVVEKALPREQNNLAEALGIKIFVIPVNI